MNHHEHAHKNDIVTVLNPEGRSPIVMVCEHASCFIPPELNDLGVSADALQSHAVWDPGALAVARGVAQRLDAVLVASNVSRLVYDCNRPPSAPDALPHQSETIAVPGNMNLTPAERRARAETYYEPFRASLAQAIAAKTDPIVVTMHSFTPIYYGQNRSVEIGILHDQDARLADAMIEMAPAHSDAKVERNQPYGPEDGVTHTLKEHAISAGHLNVMLEIRNDLIQSADSQDAMAARLADWLTAALKAVQGSAP